MSSELGFVMLILLHLVAELFVVLIQFHEAVDVRGRLPDDMLQGVCPVSASENVMMPAFAVTVAIELLLHRGKVSQVASRIADRRAPTANDKGQQGLTGGIQTIVPWFFHRLLLSGSVILVNSAMPKSASFNVG